MKKYAILLSMVLAACAVPLNADTPTVPSAIPQQEFSPIYETIVEPLPSIVPAKTPQKPHREVKVIPKPKVVTHWKYDQEISWYGPGLFGNGTACGQKYTKEILGVAHKTLPCGTKVMFKYKGRTITVRVIDRGPYVAGRQWDLSAATARYLHHQFTGPIWYHIVKGN